jgi:hypothetical protein
MSGIAGANREFLISRRARAVASRFEPVPISRWTATDAVQPVPVAAGTSGYLTWVSGTS